MTDSMLDLGLGWEGGSMGRSSAVPRGFGAMDTRSIRSTDCDGREPGHGREVSGWINDALESQASSVVSSEGKEEPLPAHTWGIWGKSYQLCDKVHTI